MGCARGVPATASQPVIYICDLYSYYIRIIVCILIIHSLLKNAYAIRTNKRGRIIIPGSANELRPRCFLVGLSHFLSSLLIQNVRTFTTRTSTSTTGSSRTTSSIESGSTGYCYRYRYVTLIDLGDPRCSFFFSTPQLHTSAAGDVKVLLILCNLYT